MKICPAWVRLPRVVRDIPLDYIQSGNWKVVPCQTVEEARDFQWYGIDKMRPPLNKYMQFWDLNCENVYQELLDDMLTSEFIEFSSTLNIILFLRKKV